MTRTKTRTRARTTQAATATIRSREKRRTRRRGPRALMTAGLMTVAIAAADVDAAWAAGGGIGQVKSFASRLTTYVTVVAASVAVLFIALNGIRWTMSSGNHTRQAEARAGLLAAAAGLAIALSAGLIVHLVVAALR